MFQAIIRKTAFPNFAAGAVMFGISTTAGSGMERSFLLFAILFFALLRYVAVVVGLDGTCAFESFVWRGVKKLVEPSVGISHL